MDDHCDLPSPIDYQLCSYRGSRLSFRGPAVAVEHPYVAVLGGTETFGKYIQSPYPALLERRLGLPVANFGVAQAGLSLFSEEPWLLDACSRAEATVIQVMGAQNMSNRLYSVHSRRNDRFLSVSPALRDMFPEVDFAEVNFTGHLLGTLAKQSRAEFHVLIDELKWAWIQRMKRIVTLIDSDVVLLWLAERSPDAGGDCLDRGEPLYIDREMLNEIEGDVSGIVEVVSAPGQRDFDGMIFGEGEFDAACQMPGPSTHLRAAKELADRLADLGVLAGPHQTRARA